MNSDAMTGGAIDTFRNTTPTANQHFVQKLKLRQVPVTGSHRL